VYGLGGQLCCGENESQVVPGANETRRLGDVGIAAGNSKDVEAIAQVPREPVTLADDLRAGERLEAARAPRPAFEMLVITLDALLLRFARDVLSLRRCNAAGGMRKTLHPIVVLPRYE